MCAPPFPLFSSFTQLMSTAGKTTQSTHSSGIASVASCDFAEKGSTFESRGSGTAKLEKKSKNRIANLFSAVNVAKSHLLMIW